MTADFRQAPLDLLNALMRAPEGELAALADAGLTPDCAWDVSAPFGRLEGAAAILEGLILPLRAALGHARRRDEIFIGGANRRAQGGEWVASVTHTLGNFTAPLHGIAPHDHLAFLRSGEFYRIDAGRIAEGKLIIDLLDLLRQTGRLTLPSLGAEMLFPGPATHDGILPSGGAGAGKASLDLVERMFAGLHDYDPVTFASVDQTGPEGCWAPDMLWYGPAGIGSNYRWSGFVKDHREAFLRAFPDRKGGNHYCRIGDGNYAAVSGWPSMTMTHASDYLGIPATHRALTLRVMDFYRCENGKIAENWVMLDYIDLFRQMGVDPLDSRAENGEAV